MKPYLHLILSLLLGCTAANAAQFPISSTFDNGAPGDWVQMNINSLGMDAETDVLIDIPFEVPDLTTPPPPAPGEGLLSFYDMDNGDWGFVNSGKFAGDLSAAFGGTLSFTQRWGTLTPGGDLTENSAPNVMFYGLDATGQKIAIINFIPASLTRDEEHPFSQPLNTNGGWYWVDEFTPFVPSGELTLATDEQIKQVLANVQSLYILGEFYTGSDRGYLDNVVLTAPAAQMSTVTVGNAAANESTGKITFPVTLSAPSATQIDLIYQSAELSDFSRYPAHATAGSDFVSSTSTLHIPAGAATAEITVDLINDSLIEAEPEAFRLLLTAPSNATLNQAPPVGTINDDDIDSYWLWAAANGLTAEDPPDADFDGDGESNRIERLLASDPSGYQAGDGQLVPVTGADTGRQRYEFRLQAGPRINWVLESSRNLQSWNVDVAAIDYFLTQDTSGSALRKLTLEVPVTSDARKFWRIRVMAY